MRERSEGETKTGETNAGGTSEGLRLSHIGIAVEDLGEACRKFAALLGTAPSPVEEVPSEGVRVSFFELENCRIELLESTRPNSPIAKFLAAGRRGVHHLAFWKSGGSLSPLIESLRSGGIPVLDETPRRGAGGTEAIFVHPRGAEGVLIEFIAPEGEADT